MREYISNEPLELAKLIAESEDPASGALAIFVGTVREENDGHQVVGMDYEAEPVLAAKILEKIEREACERFSVRSCRIVHRVGHIALGEASVIIVVRSKHRDAAFTALRYAIDELKARAPIWKLEHYADGTTSYLEGIALCASREKAR